VASDRVLPRSLVWASSLDVLPLDSVVERRSGYLIVRSPSNPKHYWGNFLLFDDAPGEGDAVRWEALFEQAFDNEPRVRHRMFGWDTTDGRQGAAREEFEARGYRIEEWIGLVAEAGLLLPHDRRSHEVEVRALDPLGDSELWAGVLELQIAGRDPVHEEDEHRAYSHARQVELRELFQAGRGAWYVALAPDASEVLGSCGIVVTGGRGRYQAVDVALPHRRRGIASRLVVEAARLSVETFAPEQFVIVADASYHALTLYESLGFERQERVASVSLTPVDNGGRN
jgi:ribosomal protein S18 acetylase RimI-like enzyme